jgi:toxin YoeB
MEIFFNELSLEPYCETPENAQQRVVEMLGTLKELRKHDYRILRTYDNFLAEEICKGYTFSDFLNDANISRDLKILLRSVIANPFICENSEVEDEYILNTFNTENHQEEIVQTEGIASAYLYNEPSISINSSTFWCKTPLILNITNKDKEVTVANIQNFWNEQSVSDWATKIVDDIPLNSEENILKVFPMGQFVFEQRAIEELIEWYYDDARYLSKIKDLIVDIKANPFAGGIGHTEVLKKSNGMASKRIVKKDRITYTYTAELITIHQCKGHYDDK